jgi:serine/threonine-protein kinase
MGVVYRAHDERLDRGVSIKELPEAVAQDEAPLTRFEGEAKAVAKLSYPTILDVSGLGDHEVLWPSAVWSAHSSSPRSLAG